MKPPVLRRPRPSDTGVLHRLFEEVLSDTLRRNGLSSMTEILEEEISRKKEILAGFFDTGGRGRFFLVALVQERIVGCGEFGNASPLIADNTDGDLASLKEIGSVFVLPGYQKRGIGSAVIEGLGRELSARGETGACLDSGYRTAQKIWAARFGPPEFLLKDFWGEGLDHMIWRVGLEKLIY